LCGVALGVEERLLVLLSSANDKEFRRERL
jgi:hypothetical protein